MAVQIQLRRDSAADWASANPVLALGEPGVETDTLSGDVTAISTTTFTNKSGNISQWTNDSNY